MDIGFQDILMFFKFFFPQLKQNMIISNKHGIYQFPNYIRPRILEI